MKKNWLIMLAIAMMGSFVVACSSDNNTDEVTPPATNTEKPATGKKVILTGSFGVRNSALDASRGTRAVDSQGKVTWQSTDKFSLSYYSNAIGDYTKVEVGLDSILNNLDAFFTVTLDDPDLDKDMTFIYPASAANDKGSSYNETALLKKQKGTLADVSANWDIAMAKVKATYDASESVVRHATLDNIHLYNQLCICEINLVTNNTFDAEGVMLTIEDGEHTYVVNPDGETSQFTVALIPVTNQNFVFTVDTGKEKLIYSYYKDFADVTVADKECIGKFVAADGKVYTRIGKEAIQYTRRANGVTLERNKYYKVDDLNVHGNGVKPIGVIAWLGADSELSCGKNHGLVMSILKDINEIEWTEDGAGESQNESIFTSYVESISDCETKFINGSLYTNQLAADHNSHIHPVFDEIKQYRIRYNEELQDLENKSGVDVDEWFVPSAAQWLAILGSDGLGGYSGTWSWNAYLAGSDVIYNKLSDVLTDSYMIRNNKSYWTCTQADKKNAVAVSFSATEGIKVGKLLKYQNENTVMRPFFAF